MATNNQQPDYIRIDPGSINSFQDVGNNLISPMNRFNETVATSLNGSLTFVTNVIVPTYTITFSTPANYSTSGANPNFTQIQFAGPYSGMSAVMIGDISLASQTNAVLTNLIGPPQWQEVNPGQVTVFYIAGLTANTKYNVTFFVV